MIVRPVFPDLQRFIPILIKSAEQPQSRIIERGVDNDFAFFPNLAFLSFIVDQMNVIDRIGFSHRPDTWFKEFKVSKHDGAFRLTEPFMKLMPCHA